MVWLSRNLCVCEGRAVEIGKYLQKSQIFFLEIAYFCQGGVENSAPFLLPKNEKQVELENFATYRIFFIFL
jgi:hypothetical protein